MEKSIKANKQKKVSTTTYDALGFTYTVTKEDGVRTYELRHADADISVHIKTADLPLVIDVIKNISELCGVELMFKLGTTLVDIKSVRNCAGLLPILQSMH